MSNALAEYEKLVLVFAGKEGISTGQMFGKLCLKVNGKAFIAQHKETVVFKLSAEPHAKAMALADAQLWDPSGKGRPMKEWVALPATHAKKFAVLANAAMDYVLSLE
ncbi:hypothetical protein [Undibacterium sp. TJN19]|uniref:hypothetical protein n=1 Tax=Undibacterium sp. TJN19 TaxID=3413055 RepID=UPI003BEF93F9